MGIEERGLGVVVVVVVDKWCWAERNQSLASTAFRRKSPGSRRTRDSEASCDSSSRPQALKASEAFLNLEPLYENSAPPAQLSLNTFGYLHQQHSTLLQADCNFCAPSRVPRVLDNSRGRSPILGLQLTLSSVHALPPLSSRLTVHIDFPPLLCRLTTRCRWQMAMLQVSTNHQA